MATPFVAISEQNFRAYGLAGELTRLRKILIETDELLAGLSAYLAIQENYDTVAINQLEQARALLATQRPTGNAT